ncbi:hypothetical protein XA68_14521 [Ophiocordyceps unilateralis]|uniref:tRNA ligase n=1 Tax=Ophiocordyceps unilateralis TaxID=268505 RepID=A0A2A9P940_OPHUN|nr:hypothetical protein XA68_14521 [Ophiocordyceps unilateralis]
MNVVSRSAQRLLSLRHCRVVPSMAAPPPTTHLATQHIPGQVQSLATVAPQANEESLAPVMEFLENGLKKKNKFAILSRKTTFDVKSSRDGIKLDSWRLREHDYKRQWLPTYARGLFTTKRKDGTPEIAVRGYDKFFNIGEVRHTKWENIITQTKPPYDLTLKENGCIIFFAGLEDGTLVVCSKHSTGDRPNCVSHANAGEALLEKQLAAIGKTKEEFARELRERNATAVAELCDDSFEEHILAYEPEKAGLYLHGINHNLPIFSTYASSDVQDFADQWGFRKIGFITMNDVKSVKAFLEETARTGAYEGRDIEGFVIRCKMSTEPEVKPYQDWFFKFKFDEPYLMYRQWREVTKMMISGKEPTYKRHKLITGKYLEFARKRLAADPELGRRYLENHGIIALRNDFLRAENLKGSEAADMDEPAGVKDKPKVEIMSDVTGNVILCPVATIGCGKTTCAMALSQLFGWGHVQNDNIAGRNRPPRFTRAVLEGLKGRPAVFADRNNTEKRERLQLLRDLKEKNGQVKVVCLHYVHDEANMDNIRQLTTQRVKLRGDNHQTIKAARDPEKQETIMGGFLGRYEPCEPWSHPDSGFDLVIDLDPLADSRVNLETIVTQLHKYFPHLMNLPSSEQLDSAIKHALEHKIPQSEPMRQKKGRDYWVHNLHYMSVNVESKAVNEALQQAFEAADEQTSGFFKKLKLTGRVQKDFHVTLIHRSSSKDYPELWQRYMNALEPVEGDDGKIGECSVVLERIVFDDRIMAIVVRLVDEEGKWECVNRVAHITVGTRDASIKAKESNDLLAKWLDGGVKKGLMQELVFEQKPTIAGNVGAVRLR